MCKLGMPNGHPTLGEAKPDSVAHMQRIAPHDFPWRILLRITTYAILPPMNIQDFQAKWRNSQLKERSASQEHFINLCQALGYPTPADLDRIGDFYTFEKGAAKSSGGNGFADVWWRGKFAWEYKGGKANLNAAYQQLLQYREDLENPPLLVVCDLHRFEVHTNFTGTAKQVHAFTVDELDLPDTQRILRAIFDDPDRLRPTRTVESVTEEAARRFGSLAQKLHARGVEPERAAHFLVQLLFCLFAEDVGLLPRGLFGRLLTYAATRPERFTEQITELFEAMRDGGDFSLNDILRFNGGLFATIDVMALEADELTELSHASTLDWSAVEPAIFGTLFERSLDPTKRAQLGAHYTGRRDIERVVEPVVMAPLRRRWDAIKAQAAPIIAARNEATTVQVRRNREGDLAGLLFAFQEELVALRVLDPACGSGNFLYVALAALKDLEKEVGTYGATNGLPMMLPRVSPSQMLGLEINEVAHELAQVVIWIGYLQWMATNGFQVNRNPVLDSLESITLQDALLDRSDPDNPREATWPAADFIIGNPPFLGAKSCVAELGYEYRVKIFQGVQRSRTGGCPTWLDISSRRRELPSKPVLRVALVFYQPIVFATAQRGLFWIASRTLAISSSRGTTSRGFSMEQRSNFHRRI